jgi:CYTH domain-containing protein
MALEIERKFRVNTALWQPCGPGNTLRQGYLNRDTARTVRIRSCHGPAGEAQAFITIKGATTGLSRGEWEYPVPLADADALLLLCDGPLIEKTRYQQLVGQHGWEIDVFAGLNAGLVVAEIELTAENETFERPAWLGEEVSHDPRYFNSALAQHPWSTWEHLAPPGPWATSAAQGLL